MCHVMFCLLINGTEFILMKMKKCKEITNNFTKSWNNFIANSWANQYGMLSMSLGGNSCWSSRIDVESLMHGKMLPLKWFMKSWNRLNRNQGGVWYCMLSTRMMIDNTVFFIAIVAHAISGRFLRSLANMQLHAFQIGGKHQRHIVPMLQDHNSTRNICPCPPPNFTHETMESYDIHPPSNRHPLERPRCNRRRDADEEPSTYCCPTSKQTVTCALYKQVGHNKRTYDIRIQLSMRTKGHDLTISSDSSNTGVSILLLHLFLNKFSFLSICIILIGPYILILFSFFLSLAYAWLWIITLNSLYIFNFL